MSDKYLFSSGLIDIQGISINPNISAKVQCLCFYNVGEIQMKFVEIIGEEYINWGNDDDYLISLVGHKLGMGERIEPNDPLYPTKPFKNYNFTSTRDTITSTTIPENRSVHNDEDIQKITTLQEQLDIQAGKLKTIMDLLYKNGSI
jgi:hypothetical protein